MSGIEALLSKPGTTTMAWALVHFLWQGAAVALLLGLVLAVVPRRLSQIRFAAAVMALGVMLILPLATGIILWPDTTPTIPSGPGPLMPLEVSDIQQSNPVNQAITQIGLTAKDRNMNAFLPMILGFWILGVSLFTARNLSSLIQVRNLSRRGTFAPPERWIATLKRLAARIGVSQKVRLLGSTQVLVPTVIGWVRPVILVPASAFTGLHPDELEAILAHELGHVRRFDYLVNLLQTFVETVLFYHPAVWWVSRQIRIEREHCCDDIAVATCGKVKVYAQALANMEMIRSTGSSLVLAASGGLLRTRIARLLGVRTRQPVGRGLSGMLILITLVTLGLAYLGSEAAVSRPEMGGGDQEAEVESTDREKARAADRAWKTEADERARAMERARVEEARAAYEQAKVRAEDTEAFRDAERAYEEALAAVSALPAEAPARWEEARRAYEQALAMASEDWHQDRSRGEEPVRDGKWKAGFKAGHLWVEVRTRGSRWKTTLDYSSLGFSASDVGNVFDQPTVNMDFDREAGTFHFEGTTKSGKTATGTFEFAPSPEYVRAMVQLGYDADDVDYEQMFLAGHDVTTRFVKELADLGYDDLPLDRLLEFKIHGVTLDYVRGMADTGYDHLPAERLVEFRIHGVDPEYVRGMVDAGYEDMRPERLLEFRIHGVEPDYVKGMAESGYAKLSPERLLEFRIHGVEPEYVKGMAESGYQELPPERLLEFRIHGVEPEYVKQLSASGYRALPPERVLEFRIHGVEPEYVKGMAESGYRELSPERLLEFRIHGVEPEYVQQMTASGYRELPPERLLEFRIHGVEPGYIMAFQELGYKDIPPERVLEMRIHGVTPEGVHELHQRGFDDLTIEELIEIFISGLDRTLRKRGRD